MIVRDEEDTLERCLNCVHDIVDEINIIDTGSIDNTKVIAKKFTDRIFDFEWINDFAVARNFSFSKATKDYILFLDADDTLTEEDREKFIQLKSSLDGSADAISMKYEIAFDESGKSTFTFRRNRLVKRSNNFKWVGVCHEILEVYGKIIDSDVAVQHHKIKEATDRNLKIYQKKIERGEPFSPRNTFYYGNELLDNGYFDEACIEYNKFLDMEDGWIEDKIYCCHRLSNHFLSLLNYEMAYQFAFKTFQYDTPRADICCVIGDCFRIKGHYDKAVFWYELATTLDKPEGNNGFIKDAYWTWIPWLNLCVCYDKIGQHDTAFGCNEKAASFNPNHPAIEYNRSYFKNRILNSLKQ